MKRLLLALVLACVPALASAQSPSPYTALPTQPLAPAIVVFPGSANSVLAVDGTAAAPSIAFASSTGTGFYKAAGLSVIGVSQAGASNFAFQSGGFNLNRANTLCFGWANGDPVSTSADTLLCSGGAAGKVQLTGTTPMLQVGGTTASFPALKQIGAKVAFRLADDSAFATITVANIESGPSGNLLFSATAPTISSGFGTSPAILSNNGAATFRVNVGTGAVATSGVVGLPTAATGWNCQVTDFTTNIVTRETVSTTTSVTVTAASAWGASDTLLFNCAAY